jgi:hypothetical protein
VPLRELRNVKQRRIVPVPAGVTPCEGR